MSYRVWEKTLKNMSLSYVVRGSDEVDPTAPVVGVGVEPDPLEVVGRGEGVGEIVRTVRNSVCRPVTVETAFVLLPGIA